MVLMRSNDLQFIGAIIVQFTNAIYRVIINRKLKKEKEVSIHLTMGAFFIAIKGVDKDVSKA
ncbi:hypothetical protein [Veillonella sp.]|uniref:hypothetical protein n=1 Tax=Veillonella sp. TaxID=1926307 RepID=UPI0025F1C7A0|nr:hypothetical protein [Veillonella sp.]